MLIFHIIGKYKVGGMRVMVVMNSLLVCKLAQDMFEGLM